MYVGWEIKSNGELEQGIGIKEQAKSKSPYVSYGVGPDRLRP